jgi:hypothetical protein
MFHAVNFCDQRNLTVGLVLIAAIMLWFIKSWQGSIFSCRPILKKTNGFPLAGIFELSGCSINPQKVSSMFALSLGF